MKALRMIAWGRLLLVGCLVLTTVSAWAQQPDGMKNSGAKVSLAPALRANFKARDGRVISGDSEAEAVGAQVKLPILRCVTSRNPSDAFPGSSGQTYLERAIADGVVSSTVTVTLFIYVEELSGAGPVWITGLRCNGRPIDDGCTLNGQKVGSATYEILRGGEASEASLVSKWNTLSFKVPSRSISFGSPKYTYENDADELFVLNEFGKKDGPASIGPDPGNNRIVVYTARKGTEGSNHDSTNYRLHLYAMMEFKAMAPILFIHGTSASSTTWEAPNSSDDQFTKLVDDHGSYQTLYNYRVVEPSRFWTSASSANIQNLKASYPGPWFYRFSLGAAKMHPDDPRRLTHQDYDRYFDGVRDDRDINGNASNMYSAYQLRKLIPYVLEMYGMHAAGWADAPCHIVAHSKGGSDCRWLITQILPGKPGIAKPFKVLGFYSLGTPFRGTATADVAYAVTQLDKRVSIDPDVDTANGVSEIVRQSIRAAAPGIAKTVTLGIAPTGAALRDQRYFLDSWQGDAKLSRREANWSKFTSQGGVYYSIAGDADVDGDSYISKEEFRGFVGAPPEVFGEAGKIAEIYLSNSLSATYKMMATVEQNLQVIPFESKKKKILLVTGGTPTAWMPNDLVSTYRSALPLEWEGQPSRRLAFRHNFLNAFQTRRQSRGGDFPDIDPGNHSMLKNATTVLAIISHLKTQYPIVP